MFVRQRSFVNKSSRVLCKRTSLPADTVLLCFYFIGYIVLMNTLYKFQHLLYRGWYLTFRWNNSTKTFS